MRAFLWLVSVALLVVTSVMPAAGRRQTASPWMELVNGKDLTGWTPMNQGRWVAEGGLIRYTGGGNGWLRSNDTFTDFHVIAQWRYPVAEGNHDSGFFFRTAATGNPWPSPGYQMNMGPGDNLGSVGGLRAAVARPELLKKPGGDWNTYELIVVGDAATGIINGTKAWDADGVGRPEGGFLGWQGEGFALEVKSVKVRRLGPASR